MMGTMKTITDFEFDPKLFTFDAAVSTKVNSVGNLLMKLRSAYPNGGNISGFSKPLTSESEASLFNRFVAMNKRLSKVQDETFKKHQHTLWDDEDKIEASKKDYNAFGVNIYASNGFKR